MAITDVTLRHLRAFFEVGCHGHVSPVAGILFMSQPAISQALAKFEARCGTALFRRTSAGLSLTLTGTLLHARTARALTFIDESIAKVSTRRHDAALLSRQITTTQLRTIVALADHGNLTKGAQAIATSQPAMSRTLRELEKLCGRTLIEKTARGIVLTHTAETLVQGARLAFSELRQGMDEIRAVQGRDSSVLTIGSMPLARSSILPKALLSFATSHPEVAIRVIDGPYNDMMTGLRRGQIDLLIGAMRSPPPFDDVVEAPCFRDRLSIVARHGHPLANAESLKAEDLRRYPWIVPRSGTPTRDYFDQFVARQWDGAAPHLIETSSLILIRGLLVESDTLTMISDQQLVLDLDAKSLVRLRYELAASDREIGMTYRRDWMPTKTQASFLKAITGAIKQLKLDDTGMEAMHPTSDGTT